MAFIGFGTFKIYYAYIFVLVLFKFFSDCIEGFNEKNYYNDDLFLVKKNSQSELKMIQWLE